MSNTDNQKNNANTIYNQVWWAHIAATITILTIQNFREYGSNQTVLTFLFVIGGYPFLAYIVKSTCNDVLDRKPIRYLFSSLPGLICLALPTLMVMWGVWEAITFRAY